MGKSAPRSTSHCIFGSIFAKGRVTRANFMPTRWIDQGASYAIKLAEVHIENWLGDIEVAKNITDKTNWRKMLNNEIASVDLEEEKW